MCEWSFSLTEHDPAKPWIVASQQRKTVTLEDDVNPLEWAAEQWPSPRWTADLAPGQLSQWVDQRRR